MMTSPKLLAFCGSASSPSKTRCLIETIISRISAEINVSSSIYDLSDFTDARWSYNRSDLPAKARKILDEIEQADILVAGSPVYKGSYSGLFKHVFDLVGPDQLVGKPVLLCASGGGDRHALVVEHQLRPLFGFFGAATAPLAVYACDRDFKDGRLTDPGLLDRIDVAVRELVHLVDPAWRVPAEGAPSHLSAS